MIKKLVKYIKVIKVETTLEYLSITKSISL